MAKQDIIIKHFNGTEWESLYPETSSNQVIAEDGQTIETKINDKVDKVEGKQLSSEDFTSSLKEKLENLNDSVTVSTTEPTKQNNIWFEIKE